MPLLRLHSPQDRETYGAWLNNALGKALWQSLQWKGYQKALGRETRLYGLERGRGRGQGSPGATALVIIDRTKGGLAVWDIPRGPVGEPEAAAELLNEIVEEAKRESALAVYFSPPSDIVFRSSFLVIRSKQKTKNYQLKTSLRGEQPEATVVLDLTLSDEELLMQMHEKCRYNIRLAEKRGVVVQASQDVESFYSILQETAHRDGFTVKPKSHYEKFLTDLPGSFLLLAYGPTGASSPITYHLSPITSPVAGLLGVTCGDRGYYYYGASSYEYRALMAPYLLQWEAMRLCQERGCREYDLLGIERPEIQPSLKLRPTGRDQGSAHTDLSPLASHRSWSGLTRFKLQFGGRIEEYPPERLVILRPLLFRVLAWKRGLLG